MEPAKIDWKAIDSIFIPDDLYENINAPQWIDFFSLDDDAKAIDDEAWFCRPDCKHPRTAEDFLKSTPTSASKLLRSVAVSKLINGFGDWNRRDANLKRRGQGQSTLFPDEPDTENQDPNYLQTPPQQHNRNKLLKEAIKSSAEKSNSNNSNTDVEEEGNDEKQPIRQLKSTLSGRDLFGGKDIFGKITDFCTELKKRIATTKVMKEKEEEEEEVEEGKDSLLEMKESCLLVEEEEKIEREVVSRQENGSAKEKKRKPFGEVSKDRLMQPALVAAAAGENSTSSKNSINRPRRKKRFDDDDGENNNPVSLDLNNIKKSKESERQILQQIRTLPPTPQCFSATKGSSATTPSKGPKSRIMDKETIPLEQVDKDDDQNSKVVFNGEEKTKNVKANTAVTAATTEAGSKEGGRMTLDVFWFLKPCALSSS